MYPRPGVAVSVVLFLLTFTACWTGSGEDIAPPGQDIPTYINNGHYDFTLGGDAVWNSAVYINSLARSSLTIDGNFNTITLRDSAISLIRDLSYNNSNISITNTNFVLGSGNSNRNDYLIGIASGITSTMNFSGTTFSGFNRTDNRGASILYAYASGADVTVNGGDTAATALTYRGNRAEYDAAGALAVSYADIRYNGYVDFDSNFTGNSGGAVTVYNFTNSLTFNGVTRFANNYASISGGAMNVQGNQATVEFNDLVNFENNYVDYTYSTANDPLKPRHNNDQHARGGALNIGWTASGTKGTSVTFNKASVFAGNHAISRGTQAANRNAMGGAIAVYGNGATRDYRLVFNAGAEFRDNYVYSVTGTGRGGAIYYDIGANRTLSLVGGTRFTDNYASSEGGAIYLQSGTVNLNANTADITFQGNRHNASFTSAGQPITGSGTPNSIYMGSSATLNLTASAGRAIHLYDPVAAAAGSTITVTKTGDGEVVFHGDNRASALYSTAILANTTVTGGTFTLADGAEYGIAGSGVFTVGSGATVRGGGGGELHAASLTIGAGGYLGAAGGLFTIDATTVTLADGAALSGYGTLASNTAIATSGTFGANIAAGQTLGVTAVLTGTGNLVKTNAGTLSLAAVNRYTGTTTVSGGTLTGGVDLAFASSASVTVAAGGTLDTGGHAQTAKNLSGAGNITLTGGSLTASNPTDATLSGTISGTGGFIKTGDGILTLSGNSTFTGDTSLQAGGITATRGSSLGTGVVATTAGTTLTFDFGTNQTVVNRLSGQGALVKTGAGTAILTSANSQIGSVELSVGGLSFAQQGLFRTGIFTARNGTTTSFSDQAKLYATTYTQEDGATLAVALGSNEPVITATTANIDGALEVSGFTADGVNKASLLHDNSFTIIQTTGGITGDFDPTLVDTTGGTPDYLTITHGRTNGDLDYEIGLKLRWYADDPAEASGTFTINAGDRFDVDVALDRRIDGTTPWDGNSLTKNGDGTLVLSANNRYNGSTTVNAGRLETGIADAFASSDVVTVNAGATLDLAGFDQTAKNLSGAGTIALAGAQLTADITGTKAISGSLTGGGTLVKTGDGTLTLSGANSHAATDIQDGILTATAAAALGTGAVTIGSGTELGLSFAGSGTVGNSLTGNGTVRKTGGGTATLTAAASRVGTFLVDAGEASFTQNGVFTAGTYTTAAAASTRIGETARLQVSGAFTQAAGSTLHVAIGQTNEPAISAGSANLGGTLNITGFGAGAFDRASRFDGNFYDVVRSATAMASGFDTVNIGTGSNPVDYLTVGGFLRENNTVYSVGFGLTWNVDSPAAHGTFTLAGANDQFVLDVPLANQTGPFTNWDGQTLTKRGAGTLVLAAANQYTGGTIVEAGTLSTTVQNAFASSGAVRVDAGATLALGGYAQTANNLTGAGAVQLGGAALTVNNTTGTAFSGAITGTGSVIKNGTGQLTLSGPNTYTNGTTVNAGTLVAGSASALGAGPVTVAAGGTVRLDTGADTTFANRLTGTGTLVKAGGNTVRLTDTGSTIGSVQVEGGGLTLAQAGQFRAGSYTTADGAVTTIESGSRLTLTGAFTQVGQAGLAVNIGNNNPAVTAATAAISGTLTLTGYNENTFRQSSTLPGRYTVISTTKGITGDFDSVSIDATSSVDYLTLAGAFNDARTQYYAGLGLTWYAAEENALGTFTLETATDSFIVDTVLADRTDSPANWDGQSLTKRGDGTLVLAAANTYTGATDITDGTLELRTANAIRQSSSVTVDSGATLSLRANQTVNNLSGAGTVALGASTLQANYGTGQNDTLSGPISGTGAFVKSGTGTLTLSGTNSHRGGTRVAAGRLRATGYGALGAGAIQVDQGAVYDLAMTGDGQIGTQFTGTGTLEKTGGGLTDITAGGTFRGAVNVNAGTLALAQDGRYSASSFTIGNNGALAIRKQSNLVLQNGFVMGGDNAALTVTVGDFNNPAIRASSATLNGTLSVDGFQASTGNVASEVIGRDFTVVQSSTPITGEFDAIRIGTTIDDVDYYTLTETFNADRTAFSIQFSLTWYANPDDAEGIFTLTDADDTFLLDVNLVDRTNPPAGWDGNSLTKEGLGTLTLAGTGNTYSGVTTVAEGTLAAGATNVYQYSREVVVESGATLALNGYNQKAQNLNGAGTVELGKAILTVDANTAADKGFTGQINGSGSLVKTGSENLTLGGDNTYTGGTTIRTGTVTATNAKALGTGPVNLGAGTGLTLATTGDQTFSNTLSGTGALVKSGDGTLHLSASRSTVGDVSVQDGELVFNQAGEFNARSLKTASGATTDISPQSQLRLSGTLTQQAGASLHVAAGSENEPAIIADRAVLEGDLLISGFRSQSYASASQLTDSAFTVIQTKNGFSGSGFNNVVIDQRVDAIDYLSLTSGINGNNYDVGVQLTWKAPGEQGNGVFTLHGSDTFTVDVPLGDEDGSAANGWDGRTLTKRGTGTLVLSSLNSYTGQTNIEEGTIRAGAVNTIRASSGLAVADNAVFDLGGYNQEVRNIQGAGDISLGNAVLTAVNATAGTDDTTFSGRISGGGRVVKSGNGTWTLSGDSDYTGGTTINGGVLALQTGTAAGTGAIVPNAGSTLRLDIAANENQTFANSIAGTGNLEKTGSGTATLTATGTRVGDVSVKAGTLALRQDNGFTMAARARPGTFTAENFTTEDGATTDIGAQSTLTVNDAFTQENNASLRIAIGEEPTITAASANLGGSLTITGFAEGMTRASVLTTREFVIIDSEQNIVGDFLPPEIVNAESSVDYLTVSGHISTTDATQYVVGFGLTWNAAADVASGTFTIAAGDVFDVDVALEGRDDVTNPEWDGQSLTKRGDGILILSAQNSYEGETNVDEGTLRMGAENAIQTSSAVTVADGSVLDLNGFDQVLHTLTGDGTVDLTGATLTASYDADATFAGQMTGNGALVKDGDGTLTLTNRNTYTGGTTIADGGIVARNGDALGTGEVVIGTGTQLELAFDADDTMANVLSGDGTLRKTGDTTATLTGAGSSAGAVLVDAGTLALDHTGTFTAGAFSVADDATAALGEEAHLNVEGAYTMGTGSTLSVDIGVEEPIIQAGSATLGGTLTISGFDSDLPASALTARRHTVLQTGPGGITGDFSVYDFGGQLTGVDYLILTGGVNGDRSAYTVGFDMAWYAGTAEGTGSFTMNNANNVFNVDIVLRDQPGIYASGWDGRSLTKNGDGTLILSVTNEYTGKTNVTGGVLDLRADNALGTTTGLFLTNDAAVTLNDSSQTVGQLETGSDTVLDLATGSLVVDSSRRDTPGPDNRDNRIDGVLRGSGSLELVNSNVTAAGNSVDYTGDVVARDGSAIVLENANGLGSAGNLVLTGAGETLTFASAAGTGTFGKNLSGQGAVTLESGTDITVTGASGSHTGGFTIADDATLRAGAAENLGSGDIVVDGDLFLSSQSSWQLDNRVTGAGSFIKDGPGILVIDTAMQDFTGDSRVEAGTLVIGDDTMSGSVLGGTALQVDEDGVLSGTGRFDGPVDNRGVIASLNSLPQYSRAGPSDFFLGPLTNGGTIRLAGETVGNTLTIQGGLRSQSGLLELNTALGTDDSPTDRLILDGGSVDGSTEVIVHNRGGMGGQTDVGILVIDAQNGAVTGGDSFFLSSKAPGYRSGLGSVVAGAFDYHLVRGGNGGAEDSWYMVSREGARPESGNYLVNREAAETLFFHTLYDRLLGYRQGTDPRTGERFLDAAWARMQYGRASQDSCMTGMSSSTSTFVAQTGLDVWQAESALGVFSAGVMMGFGTAEGEVDSQYYDGTVKSNLNGYVLGGYATWFRDRRRETGLYADAWLQHAWFRNRTSGGGLPGERFSSRLWSGSLETGYAFPLFSTAGTAWSLVPTVQLAYNSYIAGDYTEDNGTVIRHHDCNRFLARAGLRLKGRVDSLGPVPAEPYMEINWLHKTKQTGVSMNDHKLTLDSPQNVYEVKLGLESEIRPNVRVGLGVAGQFGKRNFQSYSGQIGLRVDW